MTASLKAKWKYITFKLDTDAPISVVSLTTFLKKKKKKTKQFWLLVNLVEDEIVATATTKNTQDSLVSGQLPEQLQITQKSEVLLNISKGNVTPFFSKLP